MKFKNFTYTSQAKSFLVDGEIYTTSAVNLDHVQALANMKYSAEAKEEAKLQKGMLEKSMGMEVKDGDFKTFAEFDGKIYKFIVNSQIGIVKCIKVNKKRPPKFRGHACNIQDTTPLFSQKAI